MLIEAYQCYQMFVITAIEHDQWLNANAAAYERWYIHSDISNIRDHSRICQVIHSQAATVKIQIIDGEQAYGTITQGPHKEAYNPHPNED